MSSKKCRVEQLLITGVGAKSSMRKAMLQYGKEQRAELASQMYQAFGCIDPDVLPKGEWQRCMDWLSSAANGEKPEKLLPVASKDRFFDKSPIADSELINMLNNYNANQRLRNVVCQNFNSVNNLLEWVKDPDRVELHGCGDRTLGYIMEMLREAGLFKREDIRKREVRFSQKQKDRWLREKSFILHYFETGSIEKSSLKFGVSKSRFSSILRIRLSVLSRSRLFRSEFTYFESLIRDKNHRTSMALVLKNADKIKPFLERFDSMIMEPE